MLDVRAPLSDTERAAIERVVAGHPTLEEVVRWALAQKPPRFFARCRATVAGDESAADVEKKAPGFDLVVQDEYTHDVVVPWNAEAIVPLDQRSLRDFGRPVDLAPLGRRPLILVYDTT